MRILALDYGRKRIGLALSDPLRMFAQPNGFIANDSNALSNLQSILAEKEVSELVVGIPHSLKGSDSEMTKEVKAFIEKLRTQISVPLVEWDERLTTSAAEKHLIAADVKRKDRKEVRDSVAAALILTSYLQTQQNR